MIRIPTGGMSRDEWLSERRKGIGGSDAGAIIGLNPYASAYSVWADKTGRLPDKEDTEAMRVGRDFEEYVASRFEEATGKKVRRYPYIVKSEKYPFAHANIDRRIDGESAGLECKTTAALDMGQFHGVEFPAKYYAQCVHYLAVTGWERWYLAVLVMGRGFFVYTLERDEAEIDALMKAESEFWELVKSDTPPLPDGSDATTDAIRTVYADCDGSEIELFGREALLDEYAALKRQEKALKERQQEIQNIVTADMAEAEKAFCGAWRVSWKPQTSRRLDADALRAAYPDLDLAPFYKSGSSRPFKVTEIKQQ